MTGFSRSRAFRRVAAIVRGCRLALGRAASRLPDPLKNALRPFRRGLVPRPVVHLDSWERPLVMADGESTQLQWPIASDPAAEHVIVSVDDPSASVRCLLVTESLDASGMDEFVAFLARRLPERGVTAAVLLASDSPGWREGRLARSLVAEGIDVWSADRASGPATIERWRPDVIYSHGATEWPLREGRRLGIPTLEALHGMHNVFGRTTDQLARRRDLIDQIVAVSDLVRAQYLAFDPEAGQDKVIVIPNGIDPARARSADRGAARRALGLDSEFLFVSLARHTVQKNTYGLADAFLQVAAGHPSAHLLICGRADEADYAAQVVALRERSAGAGQLHLRDHTDRIDVLLAAADAFVLDSFFEGWSLASMEALGAGVPVLLSDVGGAREQLTGGPIKGTLVANPLGDPLRVDWRTMYDARYARQRNREEMVKAMSDFVEGKVPTATRERIRTDSLARFSDDACLRAHADAVRRAARGIRAEAGAA